MLSVRGYVLARSQNVMNARGNAWHKPKQTLGLAQKVNSRVSTAHTRVNFVRSGVSCAHSGVELVLNSGYARVRAKHARVTLGETSSYPQSEHSSHRTVLTALGAVK